MFYETVSSLNVLSNLALSMIWHRHEDFFNDRKHNNWNMLEGEKS